MYHVSTIKNYKGVDKKMYFKEYGHLDWLNAKDYYAKPWKYLCTAQGEDGEFYDIVVDDDYPCELRFTTI